MNPAVAELAGAGVATVYEAYGRRGLLDVEWQPLLPGTRIAGPARIALCGQDDNRAVHEIMARLLPGEVLVLTMPEPRPVALVGDLLATQAKKRGAAGILVDAAVRDSADLAEMGLPVWTRWRRAFGATKNTRGSVDVPVEIGGTTIAPGDIVVLDDDGATSVASADADTAVAAVRQRLSKEDVLRKRWENGELSYDAYGMRAEDERAR
ncbi:dimethylmenaquinone methyltransferase [Prauserella marina]|uniref:Putative 4-hydroxy-4-methyl-2-oxoglutarate aldolase n=1 Tax=Prauserella marina TaxID=530584 RepID=A0A222VQ53_9PSEU|nr:4-carboxy-4-hydroxy-2-oxoadipate aldolase/oxaloacetate decarboxylase [Prauserella marina]ASR35873.1 dimethylmenaquinone methyltransferase [Prauserella marina]PWV84209.1 4-hydroxy-4-methyl-2-oxoglutarate aldolase [Prauserella marina]SDC27992.1 4-hydroxy-4-methyl-2-oxoglutarate aldolase [Prauserella marina]